MKKIVLFLMLVTSTVYGQVNNTTNTNFVNGFEASKFLNTPALASPSTVGLKAGALNYFTGVSKAAFWNGTSWVYYLSEPNAAAIYVPLTRTITINGTTQDLSINRNFTIATMPDLGYGLSYTTQNKLEFGHTDTVSVPELGITRYDHKLSLDSSNYLFVGDVGIHYGTAPVGTNGVFFGGGYLPVTQDLDFLTTAALNGRLVSSGVGGADLDKDDTGQLYWLTQVKDRFNNISTFRINTLDGIFMEPSVGHITVSGGSQALGMRYVGNYATNNSANPRWIPDKGYVDAGLSAKQNTLSLTTTGTGASTLIGSVLNIPTPTIPAQFNPIAGSNITLTGTYPNITFAAPPAGGGGTVTSVSTTDGFGINSSVATSTTVPNITIATDSAEVRTVANSYNKSQTVAAIKSIVNLSHFMPPTTIISDGDYNAFPGATNVNGKIITVYRKGETHTTLDGEIVMKSSMDTGKTWSSETVILSAPSTDYRDPSITMLNNGDLIISYFIYVNPLSYASYTIKSNDGGSTWGTPVPLGGYNQSCGVSAPVIQLSNGDLLLPTYGLDSDIGYEKVFKSSNNGNSWSVISTITTSTDEVGDTHLRYTEPNIVLLPNGNILATIRDEATAYTFTSISNDNGNTWSAIIQQFQSLSRASLAIIGNKIIVGYRSNSGLISPANTFTPAIAYSMDSGATFSQEMPLSKSGLERDVYQAFVKINSNTLGWIYALEDLPGTKADVFFKYLNDPISFSPLPSLVAEGIAVTGKGNFDNDIYAKRVLSDSFNGASGSDMTITTNTSGSANIIFKTVNTERMRISGSGYVKIPNAPIDPTDVVRKLDLDAAVTGYLPLSGGALTGPLSIGANLTLSSVPSGNRYILLDQNQTGTSSMVLQGGSGSSAFGGALILRGNSASVNPGGATIGISQGSSGKFTVNTTGLGSGTDVFTVNAAGNGVFNGTVTATNLVSGTYTPTVTLITNASASTPTLAHYTRVGNEVSVWGQTYTTSTLASGAIVEITLPIASNMTAADDLSGFVNTSINGNQGSMTGNASNDKATITYNNLLAGGSTNCYFSFMYTVK